jgi:CRISPR-associated protein Cmr1
MPKVIHDCPAETPKGVRASEERTYSIELITPLFGGGVEAGENDLTMPIRATAVRGQLQFWWRATRGQRFATPESMWQRQEELFGSSEFPSPLEVTVSDVKTVGSVHSVNDFRRFGPEAYALFPAVDKQSKLIKGGSSFQLHLRWPHPDRLKAMRAAQNKRREGSKKKPLPEVIENLTPDVNAALWAWVNFGGLGARTRRGCGALRCIDFAPSNAQRVREWFAQGGAAHLSGAKGGEREWPVLPRVIYSRLEARPVPDVWRFVLGEWRHFRQGVGFARNPGQGNRPERSRYPEPETIRETLHRRSQQHPRLRDVPADAYPRAELGLPIVFHFQNNEVPETALYPVVRGERKERMASPLILKPLALADGQAVPIIVPLITPALSEVELMQGSQSRGRRGASAIRHARLAQYPNSPLAGLGNQGSALEAFLNFVRLPETQDGPGFEEITP